MYFRDTAKAKRAKFQAGKKGQRTPGQLKWANESGEATPLVKKSISAKQLLTKGLQSV